MAQQRYFVECVQAISGRPEELRCHSFLLTLLSHRNDALFVDLDGTRSAGILIHGPIQKRPSPFAQPRTQNRYRMEPNDNEDAD